MTDLQRLYKNLNAAKTLFSYAEKELGQYYIDKYFESINIGDTVTFNSVLAPDGALTVVVSNKDNNVIKFKINNDKENIVSKRKLVVPKEFKRKIFVQECIND